MSTLQEEKSKLSRALFFPLLFIILIWMIYILKLLSILNLDDFGIFPRTLTGLRGLFFTPLLHGDFGHIFNNSLAVLVLSTVLFYFYPGLAPRVIFWVWMISGLGIWIIGRPAYHIGASGLVYGLASFLFFSGILRNIIRLIAISLLVVFLYGSLIWGIFPIQTEISWEGHLFGALAGAILSWFYLKEGPQPEPPTWMDEPEEEEQEEEGWNLKEES